MAALAVCAMFAVGGSTPEDPYLARSRVPGFDEVEITVFPAGATRIQRACWLLAQTQAQREQGLMDRSDTAGYPGMAFRLPPRSGLSFYNRRVPMALSLAFFDASGAFMQTSELAACDDRSDCPALPGTDAAYVLEVPQGDLTLQGIGPGSRIELVNGCR